MNFKQYQEEARKTAIYSRDYKVLYPSLGLAGETGEVCEKVKKVIRDKKGDFTDQSTLDELRAELGDVLWYVANLASDLGLDLQEVAAENLLKLKSRQERNTLRGSGDQR